MISSSFGLILPIGLYLPEIRALVMRGKIDDYFLIITGCFLLILFDTSLDDDVHKLISISFLIDLDASLDLLKGGVLEYFPSFFLIRRRYID